LFGAERLRSLDEHVPQGRTAPRFRREHVGRKPPSTGTRVDHEVRIGLLQLVPEPVERARDQCAEQRAHLRAGHEVATAPSGSFRTGEEPAVAVQRGVDERVERNRPFPMDALSDQSRDRRTHARRNYRHMRRRAQRVARRERAAARRVSRRAASDE
jgi:hypothetical protein